MGRTRQLRGRAMGVAALVAVIALATACSGGAAPPATVKVDRGPVSTSVSASGTLVSVKEQNLGFADRGQLAELMVKVGDVVAAGQPLARLDDGVAKQALASAQAKLDQQKASLGKITGDNSIEAAQAALSHLKSILSATQNSVDATVAADASAVDRAQVELDFEQKQLDRAKDALEDCENTPTTSAKSTMLDSGNGDDGSGATCPDEAAVSSAETAVQTAKGNVISAQSSLDAAQHKKDADWASGQVNIETAKKNVSDAQSTLDSASNDHPADSAVQDAVVRDAQATVDGAQRDLDNLVLKAPIAGTVSAINGSVGEFLAAATGGTSLAPGSDARVPTDSSSTGTSGSSGAAATGGSFITLNNIDTFQLVVPFEESDASQIQPNQKVDVSVDAITGLTKPGTVVAVAPAAQTSSGVVTYNVTIVLNESDPRLKDGQTAQADVLTQTVDNVLRVPSSVVRQENGRSLVNIPGPNNAAVPTPFTPGLVGDQFTEVQSGLQEGQEVLVPQATVTGSQGGGGPNGGG